MTEDNCTCGRIAIGMEVTEARNWNPECKEHGWSSDWYATPERVQKRAEQDRKLRELQKKAAAARKNTKSS